VIVEVADNPERERYEARIDGRLAGFAQYHVDGGRITIFHAEVDPALGGRGVGSRLAAAALDDVRARGLELVPSCPFIAAYVRSHPEPYLDLVAESLRERVMSEG
jgi:hypothetical protein